MSLTPADDPPLPGGGDWTERAEDRLLDAALALSGEGLAWDAALLRRSAAAADLSPGDLALLAPQGLRDLAALLWARHDREALRMLSLRDASTLKVHERIRAGVQARVAAAMADRPAVEASLRFLAWPDQAAFAARLGWGTADRLWRWAGDAATDANHYSKRALLWGVLASTLLARLTRGEAAAERTLDARLADVRSIGKLTARFPPVMDGLTVLAAQLGRLRYEGPRSGGEARG